MPKLGFEPQISCSPAKWSYHLSYWGTYHNSVINPSLFLSSQDSQIGNILYSLSVEGAKAHWDFWISDLARNPDGTDI